LPVLPLLPDVSVLVCVLEVKPPVIAAGVRLPEVLVPPLAAPPVLFADAAPLVDAPPVAPPEVDAPEVAGPELTAPVVAEPPAPDVATRLAAPPVCETAPLDITAPIGLLIDRPFVDPADAPALEMLTVEDWFASPLLAVVSPELVSVPPVAAPPLAAPLVAAPPAAPAPPVADEVVGPASVADVLWVAVGFALLVLLSVRGSVLVLVRVFALELLLLVVDVLFPVVLD
jgi:S-DNA-T family DNA segregation ATPase FtsK/SpoIIIE